MFMVYPQSHSWWFFRMLSVCFGVLEKFSSSLSDESRSDHKQIEEEFNKFCKNSKNRENRFVSTRPPIELKLLWLRCLFFEWNQCFLIISVLLSRWSGGISYWNSGRIIEASDLLVACWENLWKIEEKRCSDLWSAIWFVHSTFIIVGNVKAYSVVQFILRTDQN